VGGNQLENATLAQSGKSSLGQSLVAVRERRGMSRATVVQQTHIPAHYLQMLEDEDVRLIADQLYLLPFLRRYASFLDLDPDEAAMRLLREVQRLENGPAQVRLDEALDNVSRYRRLNWTRPILFGGLIAVVIGAYIAQARHKDDDSVPVSTFQPSGKISSLSVVPDAAVNTLPDASSSAKPISANREDSNGAPQAISETASSRQAKGAVSEPAMAPRLSSYGQPNLLRPKTSGSRQVSRN